MAASLELPGLRAKLDKVVYHHGGKSLPPDRPHAFVYFVTIRNESAEVVTLLGRKWVLTGTDRRQEVIEGEKIVGETPRLEPGESFSYNSYHVIGDTAVAHGCFHGRDESGRRVHVHLPTFELIVPAR